LVVNGRVAELRLEPGRSDAIAELIRDGSAYGMQMFDQALLDLVRRNVVSLDDAQTAVTKPSRLPALVCGQRDPSRRVPLERPVGRGGTGRLALASIHTCGVSVSPQAPGEARPYTHANER
jgi:hypothetical protein